MKILIICHSYFPEVSPRSFRWTAIAEQFVSLGIEVVVICSKNNNLNNYEVIKGVKIHRTGVNLRQVLKRIFLIKSTKLDSIHTKKNKNRVILFAQRLIGWIFKFIYDKTLSKILWPDYAAFWYFSALKNGMKILEESKINAVITVSLPYTGHLVGQSLKRKYKVPWIVDIGDPFSFMIDTPLNNNFLFKKLNYISEQKILKLANKISVTNELTRNYYLKEFSNLNESKFVVIDHLYSAPSFKKNLLASLPNCNKIRLVYIGTLYYKIRSPSTLLELFRYLLSTSIGSNIELHFYGKINDCEKCFDSYRDLLSSKKIYIHGEVTREEANLAMLNANILVNIANNTSYQTPSKLVEYVMSGKHILNIANSVQDSSKSFFADYDGVFDLNESELKSYSARSNVAKFIEKQPIFPTRNIENILRKYGVESITDQYVKLLNDK